MKARQIVKRVRIKRGNLDVDIPSVSMLMPEPSDLVKAAVRATAAHIRKRLRAVGRESRLFPFAQWLAPRIRALPEQGRIAGPKKHEDDQQRIHEMMGLFCLRQKILDNIAKRYTRRAARSIAKADAGNGG